MSSIINTPVVDKKARAQAINPKASYLVQAPAGSGKTELLIQRILALLTTVGEPEEVLALTFTRKAAAEMRERVLKALHAAGREQPSEPHALTTWNLAHQVLQRSEQLNWNLVSYPARLRVMTLDSFASGLARQLPILSGFGHTPTTADFTEPLYQSAVHDLLQYAQQKQAPEKLKQATNALILHLDCNIEKLNKLLCMMLSRREQWLPDVLRHNTDMESFKAHVEACLEDVIEHKLFEAYEALPFDIKQSLPELAAFAAKQLNLSSLNDEHVLSSLHDIQSFPEPDISSLAQWKALTHLLLTKKLEPRKTITKTDGFPAGKAFQAQKESMKLLWVSLAENEGALEQLKGIPSLPHTNHFDDDSWQVLDALFTILKTLSAQLWHTFEQHKKVDFIEVMLRAKQALGHTDDNNEIMPSDALLRLDCQIKHILVDEFQDTSTLQIDLLARLTAGWENDGRTLFMVGDPMQSIYRFRKAEVSLFLKAANNELKQQQKLPPVTFLSLSQNFRSSPDIIDWVNRAFSNVLPQKDDVLAGAISYTPSQAFKTNQGQVALHIFEERSDESEADAMLDVIRSAKEAGRNVGVLAKSRSHLHALMDTLQHANIPFRALDILPLNKQPEILDLKALTRLLTHPADHIAWASMLRSPIVGLSLSALFSIFNQQPISPWQAIKDYHDKTDSSDTKFRLQHFIQALTPAEQYRGRFALRNMVESTWLRLHMATTLNENQLANAESFFELLEHIEDEGSFDMQLFDQRLEKLYAKPETQDGADSVELLTMHGAKGLQWDTVILPGLGKKPRAKDKAIMVQTEANTQQGQQLLLAPIPQQGSQTESNHIYQLIRDFEAERDKLETARLLYVACTRAERELHMFGHIADKTEAPSTASLLSLIWQSAESCYGAKLIPHAMHGSDSANKSFSQPLSLRQHILNPSFCTKPQSAIPVSQTFVANTTNHKPEFSWAGATAKAVGIALHAALQRIAEVGIENWNDEHTQNTLSMMQYTLQREGLSQAFLPKAMARSKRGLAQTLASPKAQWILSSKHDEAHNEWELTYVNKGVCKHLVLDRSFIDDKGVRWVIDYKTGAHFGEGLDDFLDQELKRYTEETPQLPNYVKVLQSLEPKREIKAALYFPMMDAWRVWE